MITVRELKKFKPYGGHLGKHKNKIPIRSALDSIIHNPFSRLLCGRPKSLKRNVLLFIFVFVGIVVLSHLAASNRN